MSEVMVAAAEAAATLALAGFRVMVMASTPTTMAVAMITAWRCRSLSRCDSASRCDAASAARLRPSLRCLARVRVRVRVRAGV